MHILVIIIIMTRHLAQDSVLHILHLLHFILLLLLPVTPTTSLGKYDQWIERAQVFQTPETKLTLPF